MIPYQTTSYEKTLPKPRSIAFCGNCGLGIAVPFWDDKDREDFYSKGEYWGTDNIKALSPKKFPIPYTLALSRWKLIESRLGEKKRPISVLDIGAGHGFLGIAAAQSLRSDLSEYVYVEKDETLAASLKKTWARRAMNCPMRIYKDVGLVEGRFDLIILSHILEHVTNPKAFLEVALMKLADGGLIFVDVPREDFLFKPDVFPHLLFFNPPSLQCLFEACRLEVVSLGCFGQDRNMVSWGRGGRLTFNDLLSAVIMKTRHLVPEKLVLSFFSKRFGMNRQNANGTWIRAIGRRAQKGPNP